MTDKMRAMVLEELSSKLQMRQLPIPKPAFDQVLIQIEACGICRTDLHIVEGELKPPQLPLILGHQIVGKIVKKGPLAHRFALGERVGVPWMGKTCGHCIYCQEAAENLCENATYTGYTINGGFAQYCVADENFVCSIPQEISSLHAAPLLCGGLIGFRALRLIESAKNIGFYGFGSSAHILLQIAAYQNKQVYAFTRDEDTAGQLFAKKIGAVWAGGSKATPPLLLDAAIIFAPVGELVPQALKSVRKGGSVVCAGIHMSAIPTFSYALLYGEKILRSVTNLTRADAQDFFALIRKCPITTTITSYPLEKVNEALEDLKNGVIKGSAVIYTEKAP